MPCEKYTPLETREKVQPSLIAIFKMTKFYYLHVNLTTMECSKFMLKNVQIHVSTHKMLNENYCITCK